MNNLEKIVPLRALCKRIPAGEFEESALVWVLDPLDLDGIECVMPREVAVYEYGKRNMIPAPTLEEIGLLLRNLSVTNLDKEINIACKMDPETWIREKAKNGNVTSAALRVWLKMKGIEVKV